MIDKVNSGTMNNSKSYLMNKFSTTDLKGIIFFLLYKNCKQQEENYFRSKCLHKDSFGEANWIIYVLLTYITICTPLDLNTAVNI